MPAVRTPEAPTRRIAVPRCSLPRREIGSATSITFDFAALPCGSGLTIRSLAFRPATFLSTLRSGCYQTPRKTRYTAAWLRLCRDRHFRRLNSTRLQGATPLRTVRASCPAHGSSLRGGEEIPCRTEHPILVSPYGRLSTPVLRSVQLAPSNVSVG